MTQKKILVVGGAGYIGSNIVKMLEVAGYHPVIFDNLCKSSLQKSQRGIFIQGDTKSSNDLDRLFEQFSFDAVMHFAAFVDVGESQLKPQDYYQNNFINSLNLFNAMIRHGVKRLIFSSTAAIYGMPTTPLISEEHPKSPINVYGWTKLMTEQALRDYDRAYGLKFCALRYFNAAGGDPDGEVKNPKLNQSNLIPILLDAVAAGREITINGADYPTPDGTCIRDYIHINDLGSAHILAMKKLLDGSGSAAYNLGNGRGYSIREVIRAVENVTGKKVEQRVGLRRPGDPPILLADASLIRKELHWQPRFSSLETMISHAWAGRPSRPRSDN